MERPIPAQELVETLRRDNPDISAAVLATADGFPIAADTSPDASDEMLAALGVDLLGRASRSAAEFGRGDIDELYFRGAGGFMIVTRAARDEVLICLSSPNVTLGLLLADVRRAAQRLR